HIFGASGIDLPVINVGGDWSLYLPKQFESQLQKTFDDFGCTVAGTINALETLERFLYNIVIDYSKRFTYNAAELAPPGADPHKIITVCRGSGLLEETYLQEEADSLAEYMTPRPVPIDMRVKAQKYLSKKMPGHKWLWTTQPGQTTRIALITEALTKGVVCCSVVAWYKNDKGLFYSPQGLPNGHWTMIYKIDETGIYVFDSYNDAQTNTNLKKLTLDHDIRFAKVYFFTTTTQHQNWLVNMIVSLLEALGLKQKELEVAVKPQIIAPTELNKLVVELTTPSKYDWSTPTTVRKSIRIIADEEKLTLLQKDMLCDICKYESAFVPSAKLVNNPKSIDRGLFMWNSYWNPQITDDMAYNPETNTRLACQGIKQKKVKVYWSASMKNWNKTGKYNSLL
ncbi:MAG TPA: hypothetical protein VJN02_00050, partial [Gammaproteobacteria bacterium]|nr:hypothetical protein [Gammaproteobacteria bacterium]